jgi:hypothetical protein
MGEDPVDVAEILAATKARDHRVFAGKIDRKNLSFRRIDLLGGLIHEYEPVAA